MYKRNISILLIISFYFPTNTHACMLACALIRRNAKVYQITSISSKHKKYKFIVSQLHIVMVHKFAWSSAYMRIRVLISKPHRTANTLACAKCMHNPSMCECKLLWILYAMVNELVWMCRAQQEYSVNAISVGVTQFSPYLLSVDLIFLPQIQIHSEAK